MGIIVIAASLGGLVPLQRIVSRLPRRCAAPVFIVMHVGHHSSQLPRILRRVTQLPVLHPPNDTPIRPGHVYVAPPDHHMRVDQGCIRLSRDAKVNHARPAADPLFMSAARSYGSDTLGVVLTGGDGDGAAGLRAIKENGGIALVQDPREALAPSMPRTAIAADHPDLCLSIEEIADFVAAFCVGGAVGHAAMAGGVKYSTNARSSG
jgi:two-component system chemotaxis response regulator CheB